MIEHIKCHIFESGADIILHQVNCQGVMGSGIAKQVREKYPEVYARYRQLCDEMKDNRAELLGKTQFVRTYEGCYIVNLFAQENFGYDGKCYTDYDALRECLAHTHSCCFEETIAIPYLMGCHRGGGRWDIVYEMIKEIFGDTDNTVLICEYNGG